VRLCAVLAILRIFAHFWPRFLHRFSLHFGAQNRPIFNPQNDPIFEPKNRTIEESTLPPKNYAAKQLNSGSKNSTKNHPKNDPKKQPITNLKIPSFFTVR